MEWSITGNEYTKLYHSSVRPQYSRGSLGEPACSDERDWYEAPVPHPRTPSF